MRGLGQSRESHSQEGELQLDQVAEFRAHPRHAQGVAFSTDGNEIFTTGMDALAQVWSVPGFEHLGTLEGHDQSVNAVALSSDGRVAVTGSTDRTAIVWDRETRRPVHRMKGYRNTLASAAFSPTDRVAAVSSYDGRVGLWERGSDQLDVFQAHPKHVTSVSFSPDGSSLATAGLGTTVKIWDVSLRQTLREFEAVGEAAIGCRYLEDGSLCCLSYDGQISIYSDASYDLLSSAPLTTARPNAGVQIPGTEMLFCTVEGGVAVVDLRSLSTAAEAGTRIKGMYGAAVSHDGSLAAAVSADGKCRVWELVTV